MTVLPLLLSPHCEEKSCEPQLVPMVESPGGLVQVVQIQVLAQVPVLEPGREPERERELASARETESPLRAKEPCLFRRSRAPRCLGDARKRHHRPSPRPTSHTIASYP